MKLLVIIVLSLFLISQFHVGIVMPTTTIQTLVRMSCDLTASLAGLLYLLVLSPRTQRFSSSQQVKSHLSFSDLTILVPPRI